MSVLEVIIIGLALSMDALGVTLGIGINSQIDRARKVNYIVSFGFFQSLLTFIGGSLGYYVDKYIIEISNILGGATIVVVGLLMIMQGAKNEKSSIINKSSMVILLGISVSIDALVVGFISMHDLSNSLILTVNSIFIGLITLFICSMGFFICRYIKRVNFISKYADYLAGFILIIFGLKLIFI